MICLYITDGHLIVWEIGYLCSPLVLDNGCFQILKCSFSRVYRGHRSASLQIYVLRRLHRFTRVNLPVKILQMRLPLILQRSRSFPGRNRYSIRVQHPYPGRDESVCVHDTWLRVTPNQNADYSAFIRLAYLRLISHQTLF